MDFLESVRLLKKYGVSFAPAQLAKTPGQAASVARKMGFPVVLKVVSPEIIHKTDKGCVIVNLQDEEHVKNAFEIVMRNAGGARVQGVLVQKMVEKGVELIVGGKKDAQFGPLVLFGLGGIFVEILKDVSLRVCPISKEDAVEMIHEIKGYPMLAGARGKEPVDEKALADLLVKTSKMLWENPGIKELDFNPVIAKPKGCVVVDVRMVD